MSKCTSKSEEIDYRPIFENFIQDLLTTVNKPEWPASELMLSVLGRLLVANFVNKNLDMSLRVASLDYLGVVAARLRRDSVTSQLKLKTIDAIIMDIRTEELKDEDGNLMVSINYYNFPSILDYLYKLITFFCRVKSKKLKMMKKEYNFCKEFS